MNKRVKTIKRTVHFYKYAQRARGKALPTPQEIRDAVILAQGTCMETTAGERFFAEDISTDDQVVIRFSEANKVGLPQMEENLRLSKLPLKAHQNVAESIHIVFFKNRAVASEFNYRGARLSQFEYFLNDRAPQLGQIKFWPCMLKDFDETLDRFKSLNLMELTLTPSKIALLEKHDEDKLFNWTGKLFRKTVSRKIKVQLTADKRDDTFAETLGKLARRLVASDEAREQFSDAKIRAIDERTHRSTDIIPLFQQRLGIPTSFSLSEMTEREISSAEMVARINLIYERHKEDVRQSSILKTDE